MRRMLPANLFTDEYPSRERYWTVFIEYCSMNVHIELQSLNDLWAEEFNPIQNLDQIWINVSASSWLDGHLVGHCVKNRTKPKFKMAVV